MKIIIMLVILLVSLGQFALANQKIEVQKVSKFDGCFYAGIVYKTGDKHRVQEQVLDPATQKITMRDVQPEVWQECVDGKNISPRFYWKNLPEKK